MTDSEIAVVASVGVYTLLLLAVWALLYAHGRRGRA